MTLEATTTIQSEFYTDVQTHQEIDSVAQSIFAKLNTIEGCVPVLEACHFYARHELSQDELNELRSHAVVSSDLIKSMQNFGQNVQSALFIDDLNIVNGHQISSDSNQNMINLIELLHTNGYHFDHTYFESAMINGASTIISELLLKGAAQKHGQLGFMNWQADQDQRVSLLKSTSEETIPTCAVLDTTCYLEKAKQYGETSVHITLLPASFKSEQDDCMKILKEIDEKVKIINIYIEEDGSFTTKFNF